MKTITAALVVFMTTLGAAAATEIDNPIRSHIKAAADVVAARTLCEDIFPEDSTTDFLTAVMMKAVNKSHKSPEDIYGLVKQRADEVALRWAKQDVSDIVKFCNNTRMFMTRYMAVQ